mgnify:CR=1 FL=1
MVALWSSANGDVQVSAIGADGSVTITTADISDATATGAAVLTTADVAALQQVVSPGSTLLSAAATAAIAALTGSSTAADIVTALQTTP